MHCSSSVPAAAVAVFLSIPSNVIAQPAQGETFVVQTFANVDGVASLDYLRAALPAFLAERLAHARPLRFVGPSLLLAPAALPAAQAAQWSIAGWFTRSRADVAVTVSVEHPGQESAQATRTGTRAELPGLALAAAVEALSKVLAVPGPWLEREAMSPFARDPYAFVLYGRGVAAAVGLRTRDNGKASAKTWLGRALRVDPRAPETMRYLGTVELAAGEAARARALWLAALALRPDDVMALRDVARLDRAAGRAEALAHFARWVELEPEDVDARRGYATLLAGAGDFASAAVELRRILSQAPDDLAARRALVPVLAATGERAALIEDLEAVVRLDGDDVPARFDLAAAYSSSGRLRDAEAIYDEILARKPRQGAVLEAAGDLAFALGDNVKAAKYFTRLHAITPSDPRPAFRLGAIAYAGGDLKVAERWFGEAALAPGMLGPAFANLGAVALRRGQVKEALWLLARALKHHPEQLSAHFNLALALLADGRPADAVAELAIAERLAPDDAGVRYLEGVVALRLGRLEDAAAAFRTTLRLDPEHSDAAHNLALLTAKASVTFRSEPPAPSRRAHRPAGPCRDRRTCPPPA